MDSTQQPLSDLTFDELDLEPALRKGLDELGFTHCTPIQARALPLALAGRDVAGQAQTGTGKTIAFLLATMQHLLRHPERPERRDDQVRALILAPTRELAIQIHRDAEAVGAYTGLTLALCYGGVDYDRQRRQFEEPIDILIGTPGRLIDYYKQRCYDLKAVQVAVLDEADRMFDLGFIRDIRYLLRRMPPPGERLNLLFSATLGQRVHELAYEHMNEPESVEVAPEQKTVDAVRQLLYHVESTQKLPLLIGLLRRESPSRTLIFVNTRRAADEVVAALAANDIEAAAMTGDVPQRKRQRLIERFAGGELPILVATDVAARGLHIPGVSHVINFDLPQNAEDYVHRIGRTARAGASGDAISLACERYVYSLMDIEEYIGQKVPTAPVTDELLAEVATAPRERGRRRGGRHGRSGRRRRSHA